jgi:hypothetical protein
MEGSEIKSLYGQECLPFHVDQAGSGARSASYPMGKGVFFRD